jgi:hypothetical protein
LSATATAVLAALTITTTTADAGRLEAHSKSVRSHERCAKTGKRHATKLSHRVKCRHMKVAGAPTPLFMPDYSQGLTSWIGVQQPAGSQRLTTTSAPGESTDPYRPQGNAMRAELRSGDLTNTGGYVAPRAEVFGRYPTKMALSTAPTLWPDPVNSIRWYAFDLYVPSDFPTATDTKWLTLTQWKGLVGGSPPVALEIKRSNLRVGGTRGGLLPLGGDLGPLSKGRWTRLVVGMKLSPDPAQGWIEVYRDGVQKYARTSLSTMDLINGQPDPIYLKQGIYRTTAWTVTQVLYFSPVKVYAGDAVVDGASLG